MTLNNPKPTLSRSRHSLTQNISEMAKDTAMITIKGEYETAPKLSNGINFNDLEWPQPPFQGHDIIQRQITRKRYKI